MPRTNETTTPAAVEWPRIIVALSTFLLVVIGIVMVFSASSIVNIDAGQDPFADASKQLVLAIVGAACCIGIARFLPYGLWRGNLAQVVAVISFALLALTALIGTDALGAQRWLTLGPVNLQPSELAKVGILIAVMALLADYQDGNMDGRRFRWWFIAVNVLIVLLVFLAQSDLGTTAICFVGIIAILWLAEVPGRFIAVYATAIGVFGAIGLSTGYRLQRLLSFTDPWADYYGSGYQIIHSMYAFAQGGVFGVGLGNSAEKYLYLPEASTDFIFSIIGEELGLIGALLVIGLFIAFLVGGLLMAREAPDRFGAVLCGSFAIIIVFQAFLNMGCAMGVMPITGKPLPFISAGGSSLITSLLMVGIMLSVSYASGESPVYRRRRERIHAMTPAEMHASGGGRRAYAGARPNAAPARGPVHGGGVARPAAGRMPSRADSAPGGRTLPVRGAPAGGLRLVGTDYRQVTRGGR